MKRTIRIIYAVFAALIIATSFVGCTDERYNSYDRTGEPYDYYLPDYVKVCDYVGIEVPDITYAPSEQDIDNRMKVKAGYYCERTEDPDRPCQNYDYVDIITSCKFKETGEIYGLFNFEKNSNGFGQTFLLGTNYYGFPELDEAVLGMSAGETKTVTLTLPDPFYYDFINSGKELEMEIYLNYIDEVDYSNVNDDFYLEHYGYNMADMRHVINEELRNDINKQIENYKVVLTWNYICEESKLKKVPEKEYEDIYNSLLNSARSSAESSDLTLAEYVANEYGYDNMDDYYGYLKKRSENKCYEDMILYYIIRCENLTYDDVYFSSTVLKMAEKYDIKDAAEAENFLTYYYGAEQLHETVLQMYTQDWIADRATVRDDVHQIYSDELN